MSKRPNPFAEYAAPSSQMAKRLKRVERKVAARKPEMKHATFESETANVPDNTAVSLDLTNIAQGDAVNQREGNKIKIWRVEVRGQGSNRIDQYVIQAHNDKAPGTTTFTQYAGAFLLTADTNTNFTEWKHYANTNQQVGDYNAFKYSVKFKYGIVARYEGSLGNDITDNRLFWIGLNRSGTAVPMAVSVRIWYTDT